MFVTSCTHLQRECERATMQMFQTMRKSAHPHCCCSLCPYGGRRCGWVSAGWRVQLPLGIVTWSSHPRSCVRLRRCCVFYGRHCGAVTASYVACGKIAASNSELAILVGAVWNLDSIRAGGSGRRFSQSKFQGFGRLVTHRLKLVSVPGSCQFPIQ
jgi:hypothetical protein